MAYDLYDFTESLSVAGVPQQRIAHCEWAFGEQGDYAEWEGGFVCHARSGKPWVFVFGWCDTTGWGCQDGAYVAEFDARPSFDECERAWTEAGLGTDMPWSGGDEHPTDINRLLVGELDRWGDPIKPEEPDDAS